MLNLKVLYTLQCSFLALVLLAGCATNAPAATKPTANVPAPTPPMQSPRAVLPSFKHVFTIVLENKQFNQIIGNAQTPYISKLAQQYALATNYYGVTHPSMPNYLALTGGSTFGMTSNCTDCTVSDTNLIDQLETAGRSWKAYIESMPSPCYVGDAPPLYMQKHNPFIYYDDIRTNPARCNKVMPFTQFAADLQTNALPDYTWITPNMCNDAHDCSTATSDKWLSTWVPQILRTQAWKDDGVLFITFDEDDKQSKGSCCQYGNGGHIATLVISPLVKPGFQSAVKYDHYSLLRTIEDAWGLPQLGYARCTCSPAMTDFFDAAAAAK